MSDSIEKSIDERTTDPPPINMNNGDIHANR
jgi:hypothetical protein